MPVNGLLTITAPVSSKRKETKVDGPDEVMSLDVYSKPKLVYTTANEEPPDPNLDTRLTPGTQLSGKLSHLRAGARLGMPIARRKLP